MGEFVKPTILISYCIEGKACRYDGSGINNTFVRKLLPYVHAKRVCPEEGMGLNTPRRSLRIVEKEGKHHLVFYETGEDITEKIEGFSHYFFNEIEGPLHGAILKGKSPSCGIKEVKVYKSHEKGMAIAKNAKGLFAKRLIEQYPLLAIEDEGRLTNFNIREHFLTRIFTLSDFERVKQTKDYHELITFQNKNHYLFTAYSPGHLKSLNKIIAGINGRNQEEQFKYYEAYLQKLLVRAPSKQRLVSMLIQLFGYFSNELSATEKGYFIDSLEDYMNQKVPFSTVLAILRTWIYRFENEELMKQTLFEAFPKQLIDVTDSGKGI